MDVSNYFLLGLQRLLKLNTRLTTTTTNHQPPTTNNNEKNRDENKHQQVYATDGVLERVWHDTNRDGIFEIYGDDEADENFDEMGLARWAQYDDIIYTSHDFSCENAGTSGDGTLGSGAPVFYDGSSYLQNNCLEKGDFLVIPSFPTSIYDKDTLGMNINTPGTLAELYGDTQAVAQATLNTAGLYEIMKISSEDWTKDT